MAENTPPLQAPNSPFQTISPERFYGQPSSGGSANNPSTPPRSAKQVKSTPVIARLSSITPYTSQDIPRDERVVNMWQEITGKIVGPIDPDQFYSLYLGPLGEFDDVRAEERYLAVSNAKRELAMYVPIIEAVTPFLIHHELANTSANEAETFDKKSIKPDLTLYRRSKPKSESEPESKVISDNDITTATMYIECKFNKEDDPFDDDKPAFERDTKAARATLGQLTSYATAQQAAQFRTHVFQVLILPTFARILRWDRSGLVVTREIPLSSGLLSKFFWAHDRADRARQGYDDSVSIYEGFHSYSIRAELHLGRDERLFQLAVGGKLYVVGMATYNGVASAIGRSTRSFKAYSLSDDYLVWLKDTWRISGYEKEDAIYADLWKVEVPHIPAVHAADDIPGQTTQTAQAVEIFKNEKIKDRDGLRTRLRTLIHYRLALKDIGRDLTSFYNTRELVKTVRDALEAHTRAYYDARILHRDISVGNILIGPKEEGLLIDWDLCKRVPDLNTGGRVPERTGTWQFMSARLLMNPKATPSREDDLESFLHVLTWVALQYTAHGLDGSTLGKELTRLYDERSLVQDSIVGGAAKEADLGRGNSGGIIQLAKLRNPPLRRLFEQLRQTLAARYVILTQQDWDRYRTVEERYKKVGDDPKDQERKNEIKEHLDDLPVGRNKIALEKLRDRGWAISVFDEELAREDWHVNWGRVTYQIIASGTKRKTNNGPAGASHPKQKLKFAPNADDEVDEEESLPHEEIDEGRRIEDELEDGLYGNTAVSNPQGYSSDADN